MLMLVSVQTQDNNPNATLSTTLMLVRQYRLRTTRLTQSVQTQDNTINASLLVQTRDDNTNANLSVQTEGKTNTVSTD